MSGNGTMTGGAGVCAVRPYRNRAPDVDERERGWLGCWLLMMTSVRFRECAGLPWLPGNPAYSDALGWSRVDAGYILDAPDLMPAGACVGVECDDWEQIYPDDPYHGVLPEQIVIAREAPGGAA